MAVGDLVPRADDPVLMFSRSTRRVYPGTIPTPEPPDTGVDGHLICDQGGNLPQRPTLDFMGNRVRAYDSPGLGETIVAVDDDLLRWRGTWLVGVAYTFADVVFRFQANWRLDATSLTGGAGPGVSDIKWKLHSGTPFMTTAERTAWTAVFDGDICWDTTKNRHYIRKNNIWYGTSVDWRAEQGTLATAAGPFNDATKRQLYNYNVVWGGLVTMTGQADMQVNNTSGRTELRVECTVQRGGSSIGGVAGSATRAVWETVGNYAQSVRFGLTWYDCKPGDIVRVEVYRDSGTGTYNYNIGDTRFHGISVVEQPNTDVP